MRRILFLFAFIHAISFGQGHIDHIKNQKYLDHSVDCNNLPGDNLSARICANFAFQRSDSLLTLVYDSLLVVAQKSGFADFEQRVIEMQTTWRTMRDQHCQIASESLDPEQQGHLPAIAYLNCMTKLTDNRTLELRELYQQFVLIR